MGIMSEHLFQCVTHMSHFDTGSNTADQMFNIVAGVACVTLTWLAEGFLGGSQAISL